VSNTFFGCQLESACQAVVEYRLLIQHRLLRESGDINRSAVNLNRLPGAPSYHVIIIIMNVSAILPITVVVL